MFPLVVCLLAMCGTGAFGMPNWFGYHEKIGIPTASHIKEAEDAHFAGDNSMSRIVGGDVARPNAHPYLGGLLVSFKNHASTGVCGSSLISRQRLVTVAHCWFDGRLQATRFVVVLGSNFLFSGGQRIATSTIATHPSWNPSALVNDIAVIYLQDPVSLSNNVQVIALPIDRSESFDGAWAVAAGYGRTANNAGVTMMSTVNDVNLQVITLQQCQQTYGSFVGPNHICTSGEGGVGICGGDTGGPLFVERDGKRVLIGVSAFISDNGCESGFPSGFTRVTEYHDFLMLHLQ